MPRLVRGRFRTAVEVLPAARQRYFFARYARLVATAPIRRAIALFVTLRVLDVASGFGRALVGCGPGTARLRTLLPLFRYFQSFLPLLFDETRSTKPSWLGRQTVFGLDRLLELRASGTPVMLAVPHLSYSFAVLGYVLASRGLPVAINTVAPNLYGRIPGVEAFDPDDALRSFLSLRNGSVLLYGADVAGPGVVCRLFERYVSLPLFFVEIAEKTGAAIMVAWCSGFRSGNLKVVIEEPLFVGDRPAGAVTREIASRLASAIRRQPFEWFPAGPFLRAVSFCDTGVIPVLVGVLGEDPAGLGERCREQLRSCSAFRVDLAHLDHANLRTLVDGLQAERQELLVLVQPTARREIEELSAVVNRFFRFPTDWVAFDPEAESEPDCEHPLTSFSLSLVKTRVLESLLKRGSRRMDGRALRHAVTMGWTCFLVPSTQEISSKIRRLQARGVDVSDMIR